MAGFLPPLFASLGRASAAYPSKTRSSRLLREWRDLAFRSSMLLIINADDLGVSESVNNETFALMQSGLITSATLIANAPAFEDAVRNSKKFPHCSFGVHLNLS